MNSPKVSIIILNWNGFKETAECLESLKKITYSNFQVIIVDNASRENEADELEKRFGNFIKVIRNKENLGFPGGCNVGIRYAQKQKADYVFLLNNDTKVEPNFLEPLVEIMEKNRKIGAAQSKVRDYYQRGNFEYAGAAGGFIDMFGYPFARGRVFYTIEKDRGQYDKSLPIFWACGAAIMIRVEIFEEIGLLDEIYFSSFEEIDFCWRILANGLSIISVPSSVIYHKGAVTRRNVLKKSYLEHRNNLIMLLKNYSLLNLLLLFPGRLALDMVNLFYYLLSGRFKNFLGLLKTHAWLITHFPIILARRNQFKHLRITKLPIYKGSIVWKYFICGKKTYQEIMGKH